MVGHPGGRGSLKLSTETRPVPVRPLGKFRTTAFERVLLMATIGALPLQSHIPTIGGISSQFILFAVLAGYALLWRPRILGKALRHPVFLAGYALVGIGLFMEFAHGSTGYGELLRIAFMIIGAILIASLCRDRGALRFGMYGFLLAGVWLAMVLFLTGYSSLSSIQTSDFREASRLRSGTFTGRGLEANLNQMAFYVAQGAVVALALGLTAKTHPRRYGFLAIGIFCVIATFLPMSRGGVLILAVSSAAVLFAHGVMRPRVIIAAVVLAIGTVVWVPESVLSRFAILEESHAGAYVNSRTKIYSAVVEHFPEYVFTGVGVSHFFGEWGRRHGFIINLHGLFVSGTHNLFAQVTVYWGLAGLLGLLVLIWQAYRCLPRRCGVDSLSLCLLGIAISVGLRTLFMHGLYSKIFSLALGLLVGAHLWIWPNGIVQPALRSTGAVGSTSLKSRQLGHEDPVGLQP